MSRNTFVVSVLIFFQLIASVLLLYKPAGYTPLSVKLTLVPLKAQPALSTLISAQCVCPATLQARRLYSSFSKTHTSSAEISACAVHSYFSSARLFCCSTSP
jgi:hypothetical protein